MWVDGDPLVKGRRGGLSEKGAKGPAKTPWPESGKVGQRGAPLGGEAQDLRGYSFDPDSMWLQPRGAGEYMERRGGVSWAILRQYAAVPVSAAVIGWFVNQIAEFATPQDNPHEPGFSVQLRDKGASMSRAARKRADEIQRFMLYGGAISDPRQVVRRDNFETMLRKLTRDSFTYDQMCIQVAHTRSKLFGGREVPARFQAWAADTIRIAEPPEDGSLPDDLDFDRTAYVQIDAEGQVVEEFTASQMLFGVSHPRSELDVGGYGWSEVEQTIDVLVSFLYGYGRNKLYFKQGYNANGILNFETEVPNEEQKRAFRSFFERQTIGVQNAHKQPITWGAKAQFIDTGRSHADMEYSAWMDFCLKLFCAICRIDPSVINFNFGNQGQSSGLGNVDPTERRAQSRIMGVFPRARLIFRLLNDGLLYPLDPDFQLVPTGIGVRTEEQQLDYLKKKAELVPIDSILKEMGEEPIGPEKGGDYILNPNYIQARAAAEAPAEEGMAPEGEGFGDEAQGGAEAAPEDGPAEAEGGDPKSEDQGEAKGEGPGFDPDEIAAQLFGDTKKSLNPGRRRGRRPQRTHNRPQRAIKITL